jgi:hypothetical protein
MHGASSAKQQRKRIAELEAQVYDLRISAICACLCFHFRPCLHARHVFAAGCFVCFPRCILVFTLTPVRLQVASLSATVGEQQRAIARKDAIIAELRDKERPPGPLPLAVEVAGWRMCLGSFV